MWKDNWSLGELSLQKVRNLYFFLYFPKLHVTFKDKVGDKTHYSTLFMSFDFFILFYFILFFLIFLFLLDKHKGTIYKDTDVQKIVEIFYVDWPIGPP